MSSQSWLDIRIKRINYFLRVVLVSTIYYKPKQFITSTHTNYFDPIFKERGAKAPVELDNYTDPSQLVNFTSTFLLNLPGFVPPRQNTLARRNCALYSPLHLRQAVILTRANFLLPT